MSRAESFERSHLDNSAAELIPVVYQELRRLAARYLQREGNAQSLQPTDLVHEAYLQLANWSGFRWRSRAEFFGAAALIMRRILARAGRRRQTLKRGCNPLMITLDSLNSIASPSQPLADVVTLDLLLSRLELINPRASQILELRIFGGLTVNEAAEFLGISAATVKRTFVVARAWLIRELGPRQ